MKLNLVLTKKWFDAHQNGKNTEYRAITPYWCKRLMLYHGEDVSTDKWKEALPLMRATNVLLYET